MTETYWAGGIHYTDLTELLADGWVETQPVAVHTAYGLRTTTVADLREQQPPPKRVVAKANESYAERMPHGTVQYAVAMITENTPGWRAGAWYSDPDAAKDAADAFNAAAGHSEDTVLDVEISSMRASRIR